MTQLPFPRKTAVSIGLLARNEAARIPATIGSLFGQTLFAELDRRGLRAEIWCVANACTDDTAAVATRLFRAQSAGHPHAGAFVARAVAVTTPGKMNAWNVFVHELTHADSKCLLLLDADIRLGEPATLWNLVRGLEEHPEAHVTVGTPLKDIGLKPATSFRERLSLATSRLTQSPGGQLTGQLYCIRAEIARRIRLPRELAACEDGFIKCLVCTDQLRRESRADRIRHVPDASHIFEAYTTAGAILRNQKRQMIGQTFVHVLIDKHLPALCARLEAGPGEVIRHLDETEPGWLPRLVAGHLREARHCWRLFPRAASFRLRRWAGLPAGQRIRHLPAALVGAGVTLLAAWLAFRALRRGTMSYWPQPSPRDPPPPAPGLPGGIDLAHPLPSP